MYAKEVVSAREDQTPYPPSLPPLAVAVLTALSCGIFLWVWAVMWGAYIKKVKPESKTSTLAYANIIPAALLYLNVSGLVLALRQNDEIQIARMHIGIGLWATIAGVCLLATFVAIFVTQRDIKVAATPVP